MTRHDLVDGADPYRHPGRVWADQGICVAEGRSFGAPEDHGGIGAGGVSVLEWAAFGLCARRDNFFLKVKISVILALSLRKPRHAAPNRCIDNAGNCGAAEDGAVGGDARRRLRGEAVERSGGEGLRSSVVLRATPSPASREKGRAAGRENRGGAGKMRVKALIKLVSGMFLDAAGE